MALQLTSAITDGVRRVSTRTGGILFLILLVYELVFLSSINTLVASFAPPEAANEIGLMLPVSETAAIALVIGAYIFTALYFVIIARALTRPIAQLSSFPTELYTHRIGRATLAILIGGIIVFFAVLIGLMFLILPGLFLAACFLFFIFAVGVEDRGMIGGLKRSWRLSKGNRIKLVVLVILIGLGGAVIGIVPAVFQAANEPLLSDIATIITNSIMFISIYGILAAAYLQVHGSEENKEPIA